MPSTATSDGLERRRGGLRRGRRALGGEPALESPPGGRAELHAGPFPLDHHAGGHALDPPGRQAGHDLLPQHRGDLVAVEAVEDPPGLLGVDQPAIEIAPLVDRPLDGRPGDLVEDHPLHRHRRGQDLEEVPGDGLALAVLVRSQVDLAGLLHQLLELGYLGLLVRRDDIQRLEAVVDVHTQPGPVLALVGGGDLVGPTGQVTDVADGRLDHVVRAEQAGDGLGLGRGFHDDQGLPARGPSSGGRARPGRGSPVAGCAVVGGSGVVCEVGGCHGCRDTG